MTYSVAWQKNRPKAVAKQTIESSTETKLNKLKEYLETSQFVNLKKGRGRLLLFVSNQAVEVNTDTSTEKP